MKELIIKNLHWLLVAYACQGLYNLYSEHEERMIPLRDSKPAIEEQITKLNNQIKEIENYKKNLEQMKLRLEEVVKQIDKLQRQLPADVNDTVVLTFLDQESKKLNIQKFQPSPSNEINNGFYFAKDYSFKGEGTFLQFLVLFEKLSQSERILNVKSFTMTADRQNYKGFHQIVTVESVIESFRYNSSYQEDSGVKAIEDKFKL